MTKPGGRILITSPNKRFPLDFQHGPTASLIARTFSIRLRETLYRRSGINVHAPWGRSHLLSYSETAVLFRRVPGVVSIEPLPLRGFFGFASVPRHLRFLIAPTMLYIDKMPQVLRSSFLNPYMAVDVQKKPVRRAGGALEKGVG